MKKIFILFALIAPLATWAQSGTNSPYSQFGLGTISEQSNGFNRGMNGVSQAWHQSNQVNYQNPASYAFVDSLTFIFDVGASAHITNFQEDSRKLNAKNANFDYAVMAFRVAKNLGMSIGIMPFTNVGYNYYTGDKISDSSSTTYTTTYNGSGGTRNLYLGAAWKPIGGLAIGANIGYFWGSYNRSVVNSFSDSYVKTVSRYYTADMASYSLDLGVQYAQKIGKMDEVTLGATYRYGHKIGGEAKLYNISSDTQTSVADTTLYTLDDAMFIPTTISGGLAWRHGQKFTVGVDYSYQKWTQYSFPDYVNGKFEPSNNVYLDRHKFVLGGEYVPNALSRKYLNRIHIRAGFGYATPYLKVNGADGPKELSASIGLGLPITAFQGRSMFNISGQWVQNSAPGLIKENTFRINLGITFNERWFMKWKLE